MQAKLRKQMFPETLNHSIVENLQNYLHGVNPYVDVYQQLGKKIQTMPNQQIKLYDREIKVVLFFSRLFHQYIVDMHQLYQDAMSIVRAYGKPDLFITFACNPKWPEINNELLKGQEPNDRPDLIARVFKIKLKELLDDE